MLLSMPRPGGDTAGTGCPLLGGGGGGWRTGASVGLGVVAEGHPLQAVEREMAGQARASF